MAYNNNIPLSTDLISNSQPQILGNFGTTGIDSSSFGFTREHVTMTDSTNGGTHKVITFVNAPSAPTITGTQSAIYPQLVSTAQQLFFKNASGASQLTGLTTAGTQGSTFLPGGIILKWGTYTITANNFTQAVTFAGGAFPNANYSLTITCSAFSGAAIPGDLLVNYTGFGLSGFTGQRINSPNSTANYSYIAIGR